MQYNEKSKKSMENIQKFFKIISKIFTYILVFIALIIIVFSLIYLYQIKFQNKIYANVLGYTALEVKSGSMMPNIEIADLVIVKVIENKTKDSFKINDVITFKKNNHLITHRIISLDKNNLITKGDANNTEDQPIEYEDIIGRVEKIIPNIGIWKKVFSDKIVLIPLSLSIILFGIAMSIDTKEQIQEKENGIGKKRKKIQKGKRFKK